MRYSLLPLLPALFGCALGSCGSGTDAPRSSATATDLRQWMEPRDWLKDEQKSLPFDSHARHIERALWLEGRAWLSVEVSGSGDVRMSIEQDAGASTEFARLELREKPAEHMLPIPGREARAVRLVIEAEGDVTWSELTLLTDGEQRTAVADESALSGALDGHNVILIVADSLHSAHLKSYGYGRDTSPAIDRMGAEGVRFETAYSQTSWTLSSMASVFSSVEQERHGVLRMHEELDPRFDTLAELFKDKGYRTVGLIQNGILWTETGLNRSFDTYEVFEFDSTGLEAMTARASEALSEESDEPFFLYLHFSPPHQPYDPPPPFRASFTDPAYDGPVDGSTRSCAILNRDKPPRESPDVVHLQALYDGNIKYIDERIGSLVEGVYATPRLADTLVVTTSDHGEAFMQHGAQGHNAHVYEEMLRVPLILFAPGSSVPSGVTIDSPVSLLDVLPTLVELCALRPPSQSITGKSLLPLMGRERPGDSLAPERTFFFSSRYKKNMERVQFAVRAGGYKLVAKDGSAALFDLRVDPGELDDISERHPIRTRALWTALCQWHRAARANSPVASSTAPTEAVLEQLQGLGYVDSQGDELDD